MKTTEIMKLIKNNFKKKVSILDFIDGSLYYEVFDSKDYYLNLKIEIDFEFGDCIFIKYMGVESSNELLINDGYYCANEIDENTLMERYFNFIKDE